VIIGKYMAGFKEEILYSHTLVVSQLHALQMLNQCTSNCSCNYWWKKTIM